MTSSWRRWGARGGPVALVVATVLGVWLAGNVPVGDIVKFSLYELGAILVPGYLLLAALRRPGRFGLLDLAIAWPLGYAIELAGFALAGELGLPAAQWFFQGAVAVGALVVVVARRNRADPAPAVAERPTRSPAFAWVVGGLVSAGIVAFAVASFTQTPLPGHFSYVSYFQDLVFQLGLAAEALHHWPITDPKVVGQAIPYHTFVDMHMAAVSRATGIPLPTVLFRLFSIPLLGLFTVQVCAVGNALSGRRWVGPLAAFLLLFVGELDASPDQAFVFLNTFFFSLHTSPSFLYGLVFFVPALLLLRDALVPARGSPSPVRGVACVVALVLLLGAAAGAKATILPMLTAGALGFAVAVSIARRRIDLRSLAVTAGLGAMFLLSVAVIYKGENGGLTLDVPGTVSQMRPVALTEGDFSGILDAVYWPVAVVAGLVGFAGGILAGVATAARAGRAWWGTPWRVLLFVIFLAGFVPFLLLSHQGESQNFFTYYGLVAGAILAADALVRAWLRSRKRGGARRDGLRLGAACAIGAWVVAAGVIVVFGRGSESAIYASCAALVVLAAGTSFAVARSRARLARWGWIPVVAVILAYAMLDTPLDVLPTLRDRWAAGEPLYSTQGKGLSPALLAGLDWIKAHTGSDAVLAVNNQFLDGGDRDPGYMYYSAFAERRVFLEGWGYAIKTSRIGADRVLSGAINPFPKRYAINQAVFRDGDAGALRTMVRSYGVRYLVVDLRNGGPSPALRRLARPVFQNNAVQIYDARALTREAAGR